MSIINRRKRESSPVGLGINCLCLWCGGFNGFMEQVSFENGVE